MVLTDESRTLETWGERKNGKEKESERDYVSAAETARHAISGKVGVARYLLSRIRMSARINERSDQTWNLMDRDCTTTNSTSMKSERRREVVQ